jgi:RNA polymerase sigma factor (sigma-70 family)
LTNLNLYNKTKEIENTKEYNTNDINNVDNYEDYFDDKNNENDENDEEIKNIQDDINLFEDIIESDDNLLFLDFKNKLENKSNKLLIKNINISIEQAIEDYQNGIHESFDYIYSKYKPKLDSLEYKTHIEDLAQELSVILYNAIESYDNSFNAKFSTFFWRCAKNHIMSMNTKYFANKRKTNRYKVSMQQVCCSDTNKGESVHIEDFMEDKKMTDKYNEINLLMSLNSISNLLRKEEKIVLTRVIQGYKLNEISVELNVTPSAIQLILRRLGKKPEIQKKLKSILDAKC